MNGKIYLTKDMFAKNEQVLYESGALCVSTFQYSTGIDAVMLKNDKGYITMLPYMGQMIWDMEFLGHNLKMKTPFKEPEVCHHDYGESYGCFLMHCGLTAMGNPTAEDTHLPHGELPVATFKEAYVLVGEDEKGKYIALSGRYTHKRAYELDYAFMPECRLYEGASTIDVTVSFTNNKELPLEYFYLCHINYRPVDGAKLLYTAKHSNIVAHDEVPENYPAGQNTKDYIKRLNQDMSIMDTIDSKSQSYAPEIVFTCKYDSDANGEAHTCQMLPDGYACYVCHRPEELPFGVRWISRTKDEDALGMALPATAEHMGYLYCMEKGYARYLNQGETMTYHIKTGILAPEEAASMQEKIEKLK